MHKGNSNEQIAKAPSNGVNVRKAPKIAAPGKKPEKQ